MPGLILIALAVSAIFFVTVIFWRQGKKLPRRVHQHLDMIRIHSVLIKPDSKSKTFSGRYAGRLMWFSFENKSIVIRADVQMSQDDNLWIYPAKHRFSNDKFKANLERNRAWTSNAEFDAQFILAGRPRIFANAVIYPARQVQSTLMSFPQAVIEVDHAGLQLRPNLKDETQITAKTWGTWMGLIADIAELIEAQYTPSMFAGIEVDETAYPDHSGGHLT